ncbi:MAG: Gfo/Idh/MocA family oxidoreductase [Lentisphaerae bacterium]|nr:Gfo/Idh/MocA family oxidoreductase [Lentisphaerota bacterium]
MAAPYRVGIVGLGKRGLSHAAAFKANGSFELSGLCDVDSARLAAAADKFGAPPVFTDARSMIRSAKLDVFCFCTLPNLRLPLIQLGIESGARLIAFEKPLALTSAEGLAIKKMLDAAGVKAVISHQHRYGAHYRKAHEIITGGALGRVHTVYGTATGWLMHMLSHLIDYLRWFNGNAEAEWVMAQAAGRGKLADQHPSPDYIAGFIHFANGVRGIVECGAGAPDVPEVDYWWRKCRLGAQGTEGFAEVLTGGGWRAVTKNGAQSGTGCMNYELDMPGYILEIADWLDDERKIHPCNFHGAYKGFEIMMALCRSVIEGGQVALPLASGADELAQLRAKLPAKPVLLAMPQNAKEYS